MEKIDGYYMQGVCLTGDHPCAGCAFEMGYCEEVRPCPCVVDDQHFIFVDELPTVEE